jgi:hypothetical protein
VGPPVLPLPFTILPQQNSEGPFLEKLIPKLIFVKRARMIYCLLDDKRSAPFKIKKRDCVVVFRDEGVRAFLWRDEERSVFFYTFGPMSRPLFRKINSKIDFCKKGAKLRMSFRRTMNCALENNFADGPNNVF